MKLSKRSEYACLAMIDLAERYGRGYIKAGEICGRKDIPSQYLNQILLQLRRAGYVRSSRGAEGGYKLAKAPEAISLAQIVRLMDGALAPVESVSEHYYGPTPAEQHAKLKAVLADIRDYVAKRMEGTSLADLI